MFEFDFRESSGRCDVYTKKEYSGGDMVYLVRVFYGPNGYSTTFNIDDAENYLNLLMDLYYKAKTHNDDIATGFDTGLGYGVNNSDIIRKHIQDTYRFYGNWIRKKNLIEIHDYVKSVFDKHGIINSNIDINELTRDKLDSMDLFKLKTIYKKLKDKSEKSETV